VTSCSGGKRSIQLSYGCTRTTHDPRRPAPSSRPAPPAAPLASLLAPPRSPHTTLAPPPSTASNLPISPGSTPVCTSPSLATRTLGPVAPETRHPVSLTLTARRSGPEASASRNLLQVSGLPRSLHEGP
jgi:hypothetical protein